MMRPPEQRQSTRQVKRTTGFRISGRAIDGHAPDIAFAATDGPLAAGLLAVRTKECADAVIAALLGRTTEPPAPTR